MPSLYLLLTMMTIATAIPTTRIVDNGLKNFDDYGVTSQPETVQNLEENRGEENVDSRDVGKSEESKSESSDPSAWNSPESIEGRLTGSLGSIERNPLEIERPKSDEVVSPSESTNKDKKSGRKNRKHKALFLDYPFVHRIPSYPNYESYDEDLGTEARTPGAPGVGGVRKKYQESNIYYIRLPPTPYMFVPGIGYISQPPTYSTGPLKRPPTINPYQPHVYEEPLNDVNPFINLPLDFVSNGKPTGVYQWPAPTYKPFKRPDSHVTTLDKGPYFFNGRPHSIYLLGPNAEPVHQALRYPDYQDGPFY